MWVLSVKDCRTVLRERATRADAVLLLLELQSLAEVLGGAGVVATVGEGAVGAVECVPRVGAERRAVVARPAVLVDLRLTAEIAHGRPTLRLAAVAEGDPLDLQRLELQPRRDVV